MRRRTLSRRQLRRLLINEVRHLMEGYGIDTVGANREAEIGDSSFEDAQDDAMENGKAYFVRRDGKIIVFDSDGNADMFNGSNKDAVDNRDGTVHYVGSL